ncbi:hypothetical protein OPU71_04950 [Niveibacterium sp. 24ML]|uniref:hypothetical protein n=1 Tax=Niveibacterium sp. 24ML TaxID=2985512 RepID=UPI0022721DE6|nr:hypothetical protein [Niveibacterium sp. 24ML]MCX9155468.1 hypothetical protein [Niveibacterium sp. 24ML]
MKQPQALALIARITGFAAVFFGTTRLLDEQWLVGGALIGVALAAGYVAWRIEQDRR